MEAGTTIGNAGQQEVMFWRWVRQCGATGGNDGHNKKTVPHQLPPFNILENPDKLRLFGEHTVEGKFAGPLGHEACESV